MHLQENTNMHPSVFSLFYPKNSLFYLPVCQQEKDGILKFGHLKRFS